jgi:hypothetical protein
MFGDVHMGFVAPAVGFHRVIESDDGEEGEGAMFVTGVWWDVDETRMGRTQI